MIISVDNGNAWTKTSNVAFVSGVEELDDKPIMDNDVIEFRGKYYSLAPNRNTYEKDKTSNELMFILTLFGIAKELTFLGHNGFEGNIVLSVGLPPGHYQFLKDRFKNYFFSHGRKIDFKYANRKFNINIDEVYVFPQAFSAVCNSSQKLAKYSRSYVIDIGGYTVDTMPINKGVPEPQVAESFDLGVIKFFNLVQRKTSSILDISVTDDDIEDILMGHNKSLVSKNPEIRNIIYEEAQKHVNELINKLREKGIDLKSAYGIFVGGGSLLFEDYLRNNKMISEMEVITNTKANAIGYKDLALRLSASKKS